MEETGEGGGEENRRANGKAWRGELLFDGTGVDACRQRGQAGVRVVGRRGLTGRGYQARTGGGTSGPVPEEGGSYSVPRRSSCLF